MEKDLKSMTLARLERLIVELGQKKYNAGYIFNFVQTRGITDISGITPLSKPFRSRLVEDGYYISKLEVIDKLTDPDGTVKYVFGVPDGARIESVLLFDDDRRTLCVSTQVGCAMGCVFCATGKLGLARNLTTGEIVDQVNVVALDGGRISNIVFMGMGEPLANYNAVLDAIRILNNPQGRKIGIRRITVSTCGLPEAIERLSEEDISPRLAISLNAPTDAIRKRLMPIAAKYPLDRLMCAVELYQHNTRNRVTFEYVLIKGINDTVTLAKMLVKRLRPFMCNVNLIEYNPHLGCPDPVKSERFPGLSPGNSPVEFKEFPGQSPRNPKGIPEGKAPSRYGGISQGFSASSREAIERFANVLNDAGIETAIRLKMGQTINAACGQLGAGKE